MQKIINSTDLKTAIQELEVKQAEEWSLLKGQFLAVVETLKPVNLVRETVKKFIVSPDLKTNVIKAVFGLAAGAITTKLFMGKTPNPISKLIAGAIAGMATSAGGSRAAAGIKSISDILFKKIFKDNPSEEYNGNGKLL
jgi:hypothetical protein